MRCPYCGKIEDKVIESRTMANGERIRRRRQCLNCGCRFTSYELVEEKPLMVVKRDGRRQPFDRSKLEKGIERALEKRSITMDAVEDIVTKIENIAIMKSSGREIKTEILGEIVLEILYSLDKVAYIRFASAYKHFETLEEFITEVKNVEEKNLNFAK